jgi:hypothetical protein
MLEQSYTSTPAGDPKTGSAAEGKDTTSYWPLSKLKKCYTDYLFNKREEIDEQIDARRYYHGSQWTKEQLAVLRKRKQPAMTFNRIARKVNGVVGLVEKLRQDPKAYARTPQHEQGAELATATLRYILDEQAWKDKSPLVALDGAIDGMGGIELELEQGDQGDPEIGFEDVDIPSHFYDPRSFEPDFADARYQGTGKWVDDDIAKDMFPDADPESFGDTDTDLTTNTDREARWFSSVGQQKRVRLVDIWYKHKGGWCWAVFTGSSVLMEGKSPFKDEKGKDISKYIMFSGCVDQDGDRYSFIRHMKSPQDGINAKQSKLQHIMASNRLFMQRGSIQDVEKIRAEWARPDGVIETTGPVNEGAKADDRSFDFAGWEKLLQLNLSEIENFGPNPALLGQGIESSSGRAIQLLQQAGMAELGPYILAYRGWKIRVYRALWNAAQQHWTAERWIRVTDDQNLAQYIQINQVGIDPNTGQPTIINALGSLDVDIILDEGPDTINQMADTFEALQQIIPAIAPMLSPQKANVVVDALFATAPLPSDIKTQIKKVTQAEQNQPPPVPPEIQKAQIDGQIKQQTAQQDAQLQAQKQQADATLKAQELQADIQMTREKNEAEIRLEREKAAAKIQLEREIAAAKIELQAHQAEQNQQIEATKLNHETHIAATKADNDVKLQSFKAENDRQHQEKKFKFESNLKRKQEGEKLNADDDLEIESPVLKMLNEMKKDIAEAKKLATAPRRSKLIRDKNGRPVEAVSTVEG